MEPWSLFDNTRWEIIKQLSRKPKSMTKIAEEINTSVANVGQQLKLLEAYNFVSKVKKSSTGKPGKPTSEYMLKKDFLYIGYIRKGLAKRKSIDVQDPMHQLLTNTLFLDKTEDQYFVMKALLDNEELLEKCDSISLLKSEHDKLELLLITKHVDKIRKEYSNFTIKGKKGSKKIICWTHSPEEIDEGLDKKEKYFTEIIKRFIVLFDPNNTMSRWIFE